MYPLSETETVIEKSEDVKDPVLETSSEVVTEPKVEEKAEAKEKAEVKESFCSPAVDSKRKFHCAIPKPYGHFESGSGE